jgi:hypothetical protein
MPAARMVLGLPGSYTVAASVAGIASAMGFFAAADGLLMSAAPANCRTVCAAPGSGPINQAR